MAKPAILYYDILEFQPENLALLRQHFDVITVPDPSHDTPENLLRAQATFAPLGFYCGREKIDAMPHLKVIGSNTTGHPHIDVEYAAHCEIQTFTLKGQHEFLRTITPTAEHTWGLMLALTRNLVPAFHSTLRGEWRRWPYGAPAMLSRLKLGIAGFGRLGSLVGSYATAFGMQTRYFDPFVETHQQGVERVNSLEELVAWGDIITVHIPHEKETENLFDEALIKRFKTGAYFINTSRGELVDHAALLTALQDGKLAGAALDVFEDEFTQDFEEKFAHHPLLKYAQTHENLIITPHIGGSTRDAWLLTQQHVVHQILDFFQKESTR